MHVRRAADSPAAATHPVRAFQIERPVSETVAEVVSEAVPAWETEAVAPAAATAQAGLAAAVATVGLTADRVVIGAAAEPA